MTESRLTRVGKRLFDIVVAAGALSIVVPFMAVAAIGIRMTSAGPILYRARRMGRDRRRLDAEASRSGSLPERRRPGYGGREFTMYKFRTMRVAPRGEGVPITAAQDPRVFPFGAWLRATKIDELPQLINVLKGDMTLVGPRPEAPEIVRTHYAPDDLATLQVPPGVTSPGTIYYYTHCEAMLAKDSVMDVYVQRLLPAKLALDRVYARRPTILYDIRLIARTVAVILGRAVGRKRFPDPPELKQADGVAGDETPPTAEARRA
jgi:lipopolysaccharide/colanic/teichoic acid biosynthesis glycosyltransferase